MASFKRMGMGRTIFGMGMFSRMRTIQRINIFFTVWSARLARGSIIGPCFVVLDSFAFDFFGSCLPNITYAFKLSAFAMVFMASQDIKAGEQLFLSYCDPEQPASKRGADLAPYGIAQCICCSCVNATPETNNIRTTYRARVAKYERQSLNRNRPGSVPAGTLQQLVGYQRAVAEEAFEAEMHYWEHFLPALIKAYKWSGNTCKAKRLLRRLLGWKDFTMKEAIEAPR